MKDDECLVRMTWKAQEVIQDRIKAERWIFQWMFADFVMQKQAKTNLGIFENDLLGLVFNSQVKTDASHLNSTLVVNVSHTNIYVERGEYGATCSSSILD